MADRVLLRPVPYPDPERLAVVWETSPNIPLPVMYASPPNLYEWQRRSRSFAAMGGFQWRDVTLGGEQPERIRAARVTAGLMSALGVQPRIGRLFTADEDRANGRAVVVLGDALWRRRFQQDSAILGRVVGIDGVASEVCAPARVCQRGEPAAGPRRLAGWLADRTGGPAPGAIRAQQALAIGQVGLAVALLVTAALLIESFRQ